MNVNYFNCSFNIDILNIIIFVKIVIEYSYTSHVHGTVKLAESTYLIPTYI